MGTKTHIFPFMGRRRGAGIDTDSSPFSGMSPAFKFCVKNKDNFFIFLLDFILYSNIYL